MQVYDLGFDSCIEEDFYLIGIHTTLEDYRLAYSINKTLNIQLHKTKNDLELKGEENKASYAIFTYSNQEYDFDLFLIANSYTKEIQTVSDNLLLTSETKTYLVTEKKKVDFFIKISNEAAYEFAVEIINEIKKINQVITAYSIDKNTLKSKDFLIF